MLNESQESKKKEETVESESTSENDSFYSQESMYKQKEDEAFYSQISTLSEEDIHRYETFRRTNLPKGTIKKLINIVIGQAVNPNIVIGVAGICKVFIGEMVVEAKAVQAEEGHKGPLLPSHIHEAYRRLYKRIPNMQVFKREPWNR